MPTLLFKTEPDEYAYADLERDGATVWSGVSNPAALKALRTAAKGDEVLIYHTGKQKQIVGLARIARAAYPDPDGDDERLVVVDLKPLRPARSPLSLAQMKADPRFASFALVRQPRLSVMEVPPDLDRLIRRLAGL